MKSLSLNLLRAYQRLISPLLPAACRYVPTCSEYSVEAVERFGIVRGGAMAVWRVLRCNPFVKGGVDPVVHSCGPETRHAASLREEHGFTAGTIR
jgi:putative membrane protein insertion efficiency factor